ncbi:hypothetical protein PENSPDRAFT_277300 [Peniophora sp. CONT]|nr:hypothetical protein PENSPDRAFT_277300 [Peniophora sp. CONT]
MSERREFWAQTALERTAWVPRPSADSVEACDAIHALDEEIEAIAYMLASVRTRRNALVRAAILPPEVLARVFEIVRDTDPIGHKSLECPIGHKSLGWFRVLRVCGYWRRVAVQHAALWNKFTLEVVESGLWPTFRNRASNVPLDVSLHWKRPVHSYSSDWGTYTEAVANYGEVLAESLPLIQNLRLMADHQPFRRREDDNFVSQPSFFEMLLPLLRDTAARLKSIILVVTPRLRSQDDIPLLNTLSGHVLTFLAHHVPNLEYVRLDGFQFPWSAYGNLSRLRHLTLSRAIRGRDEHNLEYDFTMLVEYLRHSPQLEDVDLDACIPLPHPTPADALPISLPRLTTLRLAGLWSTCIALWRLLRIHNDARAAIVLRDLNSTSDFSSIGSCLATHIRADGFIYDKLRLSAVPLSGGRFYALSLIIELYDKRRPLYRERSIYPYDPTVGLQGSHYPGLHLGLVPAQDRNAFPEGDSDTGSDRTDTNIDPAPFRLYPVTHGMFKRGPAILKRVLFDVEMSRLRTITLVSRGKSDQGCPWTARFLRPILKRTTALEHIRLELASARNLIVNIANGLKPNADATRPPPAPVLRTLHVRNAIFSLPGAVGEEPQSAIFNDMLERRAQRQLGPQKLKLGSCYVDPTTVARWRTQVEKVIWDRDETNQVGEVGDETSDWAASDEEYVSSTLRSREDEDDDW